MTAKGEQRKFSLKRGFSFFWKSNLALLIAILFLYINQSSWSKEGAPLILILALVWEVLILFLCLIGCLKKQEG
ncbi:hypothetical protein DFO70_12043 [Cytobacillus firmus]|uniref:Uncharacterized protein n=2 Tax=Cytobacillus TaxID=2675230 RepID=A0A366JMJ6_CYTFI|nr:hypothetical protein DFO70_12043 [Cytobacillus firmus]TDX37086.1 hypothetical protein DFO72_11645 [Cytobacillus oceanisediminis]